MNHPKRCGRCKTAFPARVRLGGRMMGTGYARLASKPKGARDAYICYVCCAENDKTTMRLTGEITLHLSFIWNQDLLKGLQGTVTAHEMRMKQYTISNWPKTLTFTPTNVRYGKHNIAGTRTDVWFIFENYYWHGVMYGKNGELLRCKQTSKRVQVARKVA